MRTRRTAAGLVRRTKIVGVKANVRRKTVAQARERLVTITDDVWLIQPAILLRQEAIVIVCDSAGILAGVVTKTDVVSQFVTVTGRLHNSSFIGDDTRRCVLSAEGTCCTMSGHA